MSQLQSSIDVDNSSSTEKARWGIATVNYSKVLCVEGMRQMLGRGIPTLRPGEHDDCDEYAVSAAGSNAESQVCARFNSMDRAIDVIRERVKWNNSNA